jgi:hypothetical protein
MKFKRKFIAACLSALFAAGIATSCSDEGGFQGITPGEATDTSKPITFKDYSPKEGSVRTLIFIEGSNFGTDLTKIEVYIGGVKAPVVGSSGSKICAMAPRRSNAGDVVVKIFDKDGKQVKEHTFNDLFTLNTSLQVGTLVGKTDRDNNSSIIDGNFAEAEFQHPHWLQFDIDPVTGDKILYCNDEENLLALRKINLTTEEVSTVFNRGQAGFLQVKSSTFDGMTRDTLFFVDDNGRGNWTDRHAMPNVFYTLRNEGFRKAYIYTYGQCSYSCASMSDGTMFYNTWANSEVYKAKVIPDGNYLDGESMFHVKANSSDHVFMAKHPDDLYVYMTGFNGVYRCVYNKTTKRLVASVVHVGDLGGGSGYQDGVGTGARFNRPRQGVFVKNKEYEAQGLADIYDFYVCDHNNNCIRKVTPTGEVSTYAGRGSFDTAGRVWGWIDGEARLTAQFREPCGIAYDEETETFYIADRENKRIRTISVE